MFDAQAEESKAIASLALNNACSRTLFGARWLQVTRFLERRLSSKELC